MPSQLKRLSKDYQSPKRGARDILRRLAIKYNISITGLRNKDVNGVFIATTQPELLEGLTSLINQISEEQNRVTALANSDPEKSRELVKELLEGGISMFSLSRESENDLKTGMLKIVEDFLNNYQQPKPKILGLITQDELQTELNIKYGTVKRWEDAGLKRYMPPIEGTRTVFYKIDDVLLFLGADD